MKRRSALKLVYLILEKCMKPMTKTDLAYGTKMNFRQLEGYLKELCEKELVMEIIVENRKRYIITPAGKAALIDIGKVMEQLDE